MQPGGIHRRHRARHLSAPLLPVGDHRHLLQRFTALFQPDPEHFPGTVTHRHRLIAHTRKGQPAALFGQAERKMPPVVGRPARNSVTDGHARQGDAFRIGHQAVDRISGLLLRHSCLQRDGQGKSRQ